MIVQEMISICCHRVNQRLLLRSMHQSRVASDLLIPQDDPDPKALEESESAEDQLFKPGVFGCPVVYSTKFEMFHRCATVGLISLSTSRDSSLGNPYANK